MITIFCIEPPQSAKRHSAFAISLLLHCAVLLFVVLGFYYSHPDSPKNKPHSHPFQFVRLQLSPPIRSKEAVGVTPDHGVTWHPLRVPRAHRRMTAKQTLIRPDVPPDVVLKHEIPLATAVLWAQTPMPSPPDVVTPPKESPNTQQNVPVRLSVDPPNREIHVADLKIAPTLLTNTPALVIPSSATTPLQTAATGAGSQLPQTVSMDANDSTPAHLIALPEIPVRIQSLLVIPPVNQIAASDESGESSKDHEPTAASVTGGDGEVTVTGSAPGKLTRISLPKDGKFGVVVTGSSASEAFPESQGLLSGSVVYTVYLHIGVHKNWVLQYCLLKDAQQASGDENTAAIDAPWPFLILRPDSLSTLDIDYVMVHGIINSAGRFEKLALVYPEDLPVKAVLLGALRNWSFRPATRDGQAISVEALLVVPRQVE